ncbi:MAG: hypothetical protein KA715_13830 [Xanthomonadaceae bacterium]|nr:hypothetical protein [Xanthomonadaceae bacterium]
MNLFRLLVLVSVFAIGFQSRAQAEIKKLIIKPSQIFIPVGFDNNDNSQVIMGGFYPNTCYKYSTPLVSIDQNKNRVFITNRANYRTDEKCMDILVPYTATVNIGALDAGKHDIFLEEEFGKFNQIDRNITVKRALRSETDDHFYAPITQAFIDVSDLANPEIILSGLFTNTCMKLRDVRFERMEDDILTVIPLATYSDLSCKDKKVPFQKRVKLPRNLYGDTLIHIRSLGGRSVNVIENFGE